MSISGLPLRTEEGTVEINSPKKALQKLQKIEAWLSERFPGEDPVTLKKAALKIFGREFLKSASKKTSKPASPRRPSPLSAASTIVSGGAGAGATATANPEIVESESAAMNTRYPPKINLTAEYTANSGKRSAYADPDDVTAMIDRYAELFAGDCRDITYELVKTILRSNGANTVNIESEGMSVRVPVEIVETVEELKAYINSIDNSNKIRAIGKQLSCNLHTAYLHCIRDSTYAVRKATGFPGIRDAITYIRTRPTDDSCVIAGGARRRRTRRRRSKRRSSRKRRTHSR